MLLRVFEIAIWIIAGILVLVNKNANVADLKFEYGIVWAVLLLNLLIRAIEKINE